MSLVPSPNPRRLPFTAGMALRSKKGAISKNVFQLFSRRTRHQMFMGMTAGQRDILVSLSANLKRLLSRTFSTDARSFGLRRRRYPTPQSLLRIPYPLFFPALEFRFDSYPSSTKVRHIQRILAISSNDQTCSRHLRSISSRELFLLLTWRRNVAVCLVIFHPPLQSLAAFLTETPRETLGVGVGT